MNAQLLVFLNHHINVEDAKRGNARCHCEIFLLTQWGDTSILSVEIWMDHIQLNTHLRFESCKAKPIARWGQKAADLTLYRKRLVCEMAQSSRLSYTKTAGLPGKGSPAFLFCPKKEDTPMTRWLCSVALSLVLVGELSSSGLAQQETQLYPHLQFNFITPGARATALGGAFIGSAGDATAVESNPAGLTQLTEPEIFIEFKHLAYKEEHLYENHPYGNQSICGDVTTKDFEDFVETIPFVSAVFPFTWKETKLVFALYRQELVNYKTAFRTSPYPIGFPGQPYWWPYMLPSDVAENVNTINYGISIAVQFPFLEKLSFAVSPKWSEMTMKAHATGYCHNPRFGEGVFPDDPHEAATDFSDGDILIDNRIDDRDSSFSVNVGFLWELHPGVSFGAVYRSGPKFNVLRVSKVRGKEHWGSLAWNFSVNIPDSFGVGMKCAVRKKVILTLDVLHIQYRDLYRDLLDLYREMGSMEGYEINDVTEVHVGVEYLLSLAERPLALRIGGYYEPDHTLKYEGVLSESDRLLLPGGEDQIHVTGGVGLVVNKHFKIDTAVDIADIRKQASVSVVYTF